MIFLYPSFLWALTALALPIAIHLWSRKEGKTIKIGSIQLLQAYDSKQFSSILLNEKRLLFLRMLIIALLVLIMAAPQIQWKTEHNSITYLVEPSLLENNTLKSMLDTLTSGDKDIRLLQPGFPTWETDQVMKGATTIPQYWQLVHDMHTLKTDSIVVFTGAFVAGIKGMRPTVHRKIEWIPLSVDNPAFHALTAIQKEGSLHITTGSSDGERLAFRKDIFKVNDNQLEYNRQKDSVRIRSEESGIFLPITKETPARVLLLYDDSLLREKMYMEAALGAIAKYLDQHIEVVSVREASEAELDTFTMVIGLQKDFSTSSAVRQLLYKPDSLAESLIVPGEQKHIFHITQPITPENSLAEHLGEKALGLLFPNEELKEKKATWDRRVMAKEELLPIYSTEKRLKAGLGAFSLVKYLWILVMIMLGLERFFAFYRKQ